MFRQCQLVDPWKLCGHLEKKLKDFLRIPEVCYATVKYRDNSEQDNSGQKVIDKTILEKQL